MKTDKYNGMKRAGDWEGKKIRLSRDLGNGVGRWRKGTLAKVRSVGPMLNIEGEPRLCCGVALYMSRVPYDAVELAE